MQFTRLRLQGFKSFVDPTELVIRDGLTGVVGPNGCGKSNLLEALRWVMGENRAKAMRGEGMEDVIFAGTASRPARNGASVDLVVDNSDRLAPAAFNHSDTLEISRRITRDIGSAFTLNGKNVRARDVQMLFADASTGAHSPALVRQGQIGELINAKPKARRRILEEAAGISGLYQRRHEAELKLNGAETNLARVEDVLENLDTQLRSLERQAAQARRYREIATELRRAEAVLLWLRYRQAEEARVRAEQALTDGARAAARAEADVATARKAREAADAAVPPLREEEAIAAAVLQRLTIERDRLAEEEGRARDEIERLLGITRQIAADREREETLGRDAGVTIERLEAEAAELTAEHEGLDAALATAAVAASAAAAKLSGEETVLDRLTEEAARLAARAAAAERRLTEATSNHKRILAEIERAEAAETALAGEIGAAEATLAAASEAEAKARAEAAGAERALETAEAARATAQAAESEARGAASEAEGALSALPAEVQGLERLLARDKGDGVQLLDRVTVEPGFEAALGAALGDELRASGIEGATPSTGWLALDPYPSPGTLPEGVAPLAEQVEAPAELARRLQHIGIVEKAQGAFLQPLLQPGQRLVSREGDLWRWDGYCQRAEDVPSAAALRLQQKNRLAALRKSQAEAAATRESARSAHASARQELDGATKAEQEARSRRRAADQAVADTSRALSKAEAELEMRRGRLETQRGALASRREELADTATALAEAEKAVAELADVAEARRAVELQRGEVDLARTAMLAARSRADDTRREGLAREKRLADIAREKKGWQDRLANASARLADLRRRAEESATRLKGAEGAPDEIAARAEKLADEIERAESRRRAASDRLAEGETTLRAAEAAEREAERAASERREERARLEAMLESARAKVDETAERVREELEIEPERLSADLAEVTELPAIGAAETDVARLRRQRDALGAVNLRAEEDAREVQTERDMLAQEKADLDAAIAKLRGGIAELNREGRERIVKAFDSVNEKFARLFRHLFGGGEARLVMVESDDPLDAGLEILCQPPGKKLSTLSLLSGGEQTLTALSLIFAVFLSNPAPICVLDEVDAPLDDSNVTRFCDLLDEMCRLTDTRFLIITHHAITMSRMDRLFGVTMVEKGVSQLVSVDLAMAAEMIEA